MRLVESLLKNLKGGRHADRTEVIETGRGGFERRDLYPVSLIREQTVSDLGSIRMLARACADERGRDPGALPEDPIRRESQALIAAAKRLGCLVDAKTVPGLRFVDPLIGFKEPLRKLLAAYEFDPEATEPEIVSRLFEMYAKLTKDKEEDVK